MRCRWQPTPCPVHLPCPGPTFGSVLADRCTASDGHPLLNHSILVILSQVNRQLELYNSRDVDAFMSIVADDVLVMDGVTGAVLAQGKEQLRCGAYTTLLTVAIHSVALVCKKPLLSQHCCWVSAARASDEEGAARVRACTAYRLSLCCTYCNSSRNSINGGWGIRRRAAAGRGAGAVGLWAHHHALGRARRWARGSS